MAMRTGDLDDEIAAIEKRIASRRDALAALSTDARRHVSGKTIMPMAVAAALGIGFAASLAAFGNSGRVFCRVALRGR